MSSEPGGAAPEASAAAVVHVEKLFSRLPLRQADDAARFPSPRPKRRPSTTGGPLLVQSPLVHEMHGASATTGASAAEEYDAEVALLAKSPDEAVARAAIAQERLTHQVRNLSCVLLLITLLLLGFTVSVVTALYSFLGSMTSALDSIKDTLSPATLQRAVGSMQGSLDHVYDATSNMLNITDDTETLAEYMIRTANNTANLMERANAMGAHLLEHPTVTLALGGGEL